MLRATDCAVTARTNRILAIALWLPVAAACSTVGATVQAGFTQVAVDGDLALTTANGGATSTAEQDIGSAFGLGDERGSPWLRAQADLGTPVVTASVFWLRESGTGVLDSDFGGLSAGTQVASDLELACAQASCTFDFGLGPVKVSPGLAVDVFDLDFRVRETLLGNSEVIDEILAVPLLFVRAEASLGPVAAIGEAGYLELPDIDGTEGRFFDAEAMLAWSVLPLVHVFAGYRFIELHANGDTDSDSFATDLEIRGWFVGGGLRF
jgi:hypothetical protein